MNRVLGLRALRGTGRLLVVGAGAGICTLSPLIWGSPARLDAHRAIGVQPSTSSSRAQRSKLSPDIVRQVSSGSMAGFLLGIVTAVFSRTLVFLGSSIAISFHIASRYGIDVSQLIGIKQVPGVSKLCQAGSQNPWFTSTFAVTFLLAAFVHL